MCLRRLSCEWGLWNSPFLLPRSHCEALAQRVEHGLHMEGSAFWYFQSKAYGRFNSPPSRSLTGKVKAGGALSMGQG